MRAYIYGSERYPVYEVEVSTLADDNEYEIPDPLYERVCAVEQEWADVQNELRKIKQRTDGHT